ncbi:uncharacterized protein V1510DRAFT_120349 [Dipodascopsis tothii]|uniref:uncharacterized protein n=1 Tax=Dipodascopsis tothii TaxID=44089 RepID=UPI0034CF0197
MSLFKWMKSSSTAGTPTKSGGPAAAENTAPSPTVQTQTSLLSGTLGLFKPADGKEVGAPPLPDGSDKYYGVENFGNTCYCNSILQCLYHCKPFREKVLAYPAAARSKPRTLSAPQTAGVPTPSSTPPPANGNGNGVQRTRTSLRKPSDLMRASSRRFSSASSPAASASVAGGSPGSPPAAAAAPEPGTLPPRADDSVPTEQKKKALLANGTVTLAPEPAGTTRAFQGTLFGALKDVFETIAGQHARTGVFSPKEFVEVLKQRNELFRSTMHQDAHEFLNFLLNEIIDNVESQAKAMRSLAPNGVNGHANGANGKPYGALVDTNTRWVHELFEGVLTNEIKCLTCENVTSRDEVFIDLSIDLEEHTSVTSCLQQFSVSEMLCSNNKFHCDPCGGLHEAEKRMKIKRLPRILALHLKRFKFTEDMQRNMKLFHRVVFPYHLRLFNNTVDDDRVLGNPDTLYELYAVVVHVGGGPYYGHYVSVVKTEHAGWVLYDDELVERVDENYVTNFFGNAQTQTSAYILLYQSVPEDPLSHL